MSASQPKSIRAWRELSRAEREALVDEAMRRQRARPAQPRPTQGHEALALAPGSEPAAKTERCRYCRSDSGWWEDSVGNWRCCNCWAINPAKNGSSA